jgi:hypothetical protein
MKADQVIVESKLLYFSSSSFPIELQSSKSQVAPGRVGSSKYGSTSN